MLTRASPSSTTGFRENTRAEYLRDLGFDTDGQARDRAAKFFGRMTLAEIDPRMIKSYLVYLSTQDLSPAAIRRLLAPLRAMLATAVEDGLIRYNPAAGVRVPGAAQPQPEPRRKNLTPDEYARLLENTPQEWRLFVEFILQSGFRISEVLGLEWGDVDFGRQRVTVKRRLYKGLDEPKSRYGKRSVRLTRAMTQRLWEARKKSQSAADADPIFTSGKGTRLNYSNTYNRVLKPAMRAAGIEYGGFHRLRHTHGTELQRQGVPIEQVSLSLGHHDPAFTARVYVHLDATDMPDPAALHDFGREGSERKPGSSAGADTNRATGGQPDEPSRAEADLAQIASLGR